MKAKKILACLISMMMLVACFAVSASAATATGYTVKADKTIVEVGDTVTYTVTLVNCDKLEGGVFNYQFELVIPEGLEYVEGSGKIDDKFASTTGMTAPTFSEKSFVCSSLGVIFSAGSYTGADVVVMTFQCKVVNAEDIDVTLTDAKVVGENSTSTAAEVDVAGADISIKVPHVCAPVDVAEVPATCTEAGVKAHAVCECGKIYIDGEEVTEADLVIPALGHTLKTEWSKNADEHWHECEVCGEKVDKAAHKWVEVVDKAATPTEDGSKHEECEVCEYAKDAVSIPATGEVDDVPKTGDIVDSAAIAAIVVVSVMVLASALIIAEKKRGATK